MSALVGQIYYYYCYLFLLGYTYRHDPMGALVGEILLGFYVQQQNNNASKACCQEYRHCPKHVVTKSLPGTVHSYTKQSERALQHALDVCCSSPIPAL
jgi:hypothetical protein